MQQRPFGDGRRPAYGAILRNTKIWKATITWTSTGITGYKIGIGILITTIMIGKIIRIMGEIIGLTVGGDIERSETKYCFDNEFVFKSAIASCIKNE